MAPEGVRMTNARRRGAVLGLTGIVLAGLVSVTSTAQAVQHTAATVTTQPDAHLIVQVTPGSERGVAAAVGALGGQVTRELELVHSLAVVVPAEAVARLATVAGVTGVVPDERMHVQASLDTGRTSANQPASVFTQVTRADKLVASGSDGRGVTIALIDTGVDASTPDLAGRTVPVAVDPFGLITAACQNFSGELSCADSYGHGTFIAGLMVGSGASSDGRYAGVAPRAKVLSVKIAGRDGSADVSTIIAAIQWVVSFRDQYRIKVLNLSLGTDSTQSYRVSPLNYAVERAWQSGITVVVAASNRGPGSATITKPGDDPYVLTVGAIDDRATVSLNDDTVPNFSSRGPTAADGLAKPDVVAPGGHVVSLDARNSAIATAYPSSMTAPYRRGSGTSFATGIVSGIVADLMSGSAAMTPDRVKYALTSTAREVASTDRMVVGTGLVDARAAASAPAGLANQGLLPSTGTGSLQGSRGTVTVSTPVSLGPVTGEITVQGTVWDPIGFTSSDWTGSSWYGSSWYGSSWYGSSWYGSSWYGSSWYGSSWYGQPSGSSWYGSSWYGSSWYGAWDQ
jgi:serine protease AprX